MIVNLILWFKGIDGVDKYLAKHERYFESKTYSQTVKFMQKYLTREFRARENAFAFLSYLDNSPVEGEFYPDLIRKSKYFKTMSDKDRLDFIDAYLSYWGEESIINDCVENIFDLDVLKKLVTEYVTEENAQTVADKLLYTEDMDLLLASKDYWYYLVDYLNANITYNYSYSLEDIKTYLINYSNHNKGVITVLTDYLEKHSVKEEVLGAIADIIGVKTKEKTYENTGKYDKKDIEDFLDNIYNSLNSNEAYTKEDLDYIAKKIENTGNQEAIVSWVTNTLCSYNYKLIDKLMLDYKYLPRLFNALDKFYVNYITTRILMGKGKEEKQRFMLYLSHNYNLFSVEALDKVLLLAYTSNYHLSKEEIYGFVLKGSKYLRQIFENYEFGEEERLNIFETYKKAGYIDLCTLYGTYLIKGEKAALISREEEQKFKPLVLSLKKQIEDNKRVEVIGLRNYM